MKGKTESLFETPETTLTKVLASSGDSLSIEIVQNLGEEIIPEIINVSEAIADSFGSGAKFTRTTIRKYFAYPRTIPFIARYTGKIVGFIVGVPLEHFAKDAWTRCDKNLGKGNTIYTYAYAVKAEYRDRGIPRMLKGIYRSWLKKRGYEYVSGHVLESIVHKLSGDVHIVRRFEDWLQSGYTFVYYRRSL